ncbi:DUF397 domain-containing protein [Streptomyces sp. NBC_01622]|nr:DUF397 domain-containing protein [Streptomyces sp. NBC_01622]
MCVLRVAGLPDGRPAAAPERFQRAPTIRRRETDTADSRPTPTQSLVAVRDSKLPHGPALTLSPEAFTAFVTYVRT